MINPKHPVMFSLILLIALLTGACQPIILDTAHMSEDTDKLDARDSDTTQSVDASVAGISDDEIILGAHTPLSGPLVGFSEINLAAKAYFDYINDTQGGVHGRKIIYLLSDDQYSPPMTVQVVRQLVEEEGIFALVGGVGTPTHMQVVDYLQKLGIPDLFVVGGSIEWVKDPVARPTVFGSVTNYLAEGVVLGRYIAETYPGQKLGLLFQNDGFGLAGMEGIKRGVGDQLEIVAEASYEVGPPDLSAQISQLHSADADVIAAFAGPPFMAAAIEAARLELSWEVPFVTGGPGGGAAFIVPDLTQGMVSIDFQPKLTETDHPGIANHLEILRAYSDFKEATSETLYGHYLGELTVKILTDTGPDLTREGVLAAAASVQDFLCSVCLYPVNLSETDHSPIDALILTRFVDRDWVYFGNGYSWEGVLPGEMTVQSLQVVPSPYTE